MFFIDPWFFFRPIETGLNPAENLRCTSDEGSGLAGAGLAGAGLAGAGLAGAGLAGAGLAECRLGAVVKPCGVGAGIVICPCPATPHGNATQREGAKTS
jgi:hypothetical protein